MLTFSWTDYPEKYDNLSHLQACNFSTPLPSPQNLKNNLFIEGDNYPSLLLLEQKYQSSIDIIYIDPPYNTGNTFTYNDDFSTSPEDSHSKWLSFMSRRLKIAQKLLSNSGCIFIAIGQEELFHLKLLCDSIFGEENYINDFMWLHGKGKKDKWSRTLEQHTLCYAKNKKFLSPFADFETTSWAKTNSDEDIRGNWFSGSISFTEERSNKNHPNYYSIKSPSGKIWTRQWLIPQEKMTQLLQENKIFFGKAPEFDKVPRIKIFNGEKNQIIPQNIITEVQSTRFAQKHLDEILKAPKIFDNPKPVNLISHLISITQMKKDAIILDFFAGSGTTFESVLEQNQIDGGNRKCILIQKPETTFQIKNGQKIPRKGSENAFLAGYNTISEICLKRIQKNIENLKNKTDFPVKPVTIEILKLIEKE